MKEYSRYKYNIQDNNPPSHHLLTPPYYTHTNTHMNRYTLDQVADSRLMQQGQWKVTEHTSHWWQARTCFSVCVCMRAGEGWGHSGGTSRLAVTGLQDGVGVQLVGRWREWRSCCSVTQSLWAGWEEPGPSLFHSLSLSLSLSLPHHSLPGPDSVSPRHQ